MKSQDLWMTKGRVVSIEKRLVDRGTSGTLNQATNLNLKVTLPPLFHPVRSRGNLQFSPPATNPAGSPPSPLSIRPERSEVGPDSLNEHLLPSKIAVLRAQIYFRVSWGRYRAK